MATRGAIFRKDEDGMVGRYHHWDSYPAGLGRTLYHWYGKFDGDLRRMMEYLIDRHPAGWSTIVDREPFAPVGYGLGGRGPECYCHGARRDDELEFRSLADAAESGARWAYVIDVSDGTMEIWKWVWREDAGRWRKVTDVRLGCREPDWDALERL